MDGSDSWTAGDLSSAAFGIAGDLPLANDWNGDEIDEIGVYCPGNRRFYLDMDGSDSWTAGDVTSAPFGVAGGLTISGRW